MFSLVTFLLFMSLLIHDIKPLKVVVLLLIFSSKPHNLYSPRHEANTNKRREVPNTQMYPPESKRNDPRGNDIGLEMLQQRLKAANLIVLSLC